MHSDCKSFEVGKKYRRIGTVGDGHECVFSQKSLSVNTKRPVGIAILKNEKDGVLYHVDEEYWNNWEEVIEPRKEYFNAYKDRDGKIEYGNPHSSAEEADASILGMPNYYGRLIMTHHSETHVDVEFHLKRK